MIDINNKLWELITLLSGIVLLLSFAPYDYWFLAVPSLVVLLVSWQGVSPLRAALRGFLFGIGLFVFGLSWVFVSIHDFGGAGIFLASMLTLLFAAFWALFPALAGYLSVICECSVLRSFRFIMPATLWVLIEYLRGNVVFNGFPLFQLAYSQLDSPLAGYIPVFGAYAVSWAVALTASILAAWLTMEKRQPVMFLTILSLIWGTGFILGQISWTEPAGDEIKITMIQGNVAQDKKWQPEYRDAILKRYQNKTRQHWDSQIIIWPESSIPAYYHQVNDDFLLPLEKEAKKHGADLVVSLPIKNDRDEKFNAVMTLGEKRGVYKKIHLLPFGEYLPMKSFFSSIMDSLNFMPMGSFTAGETDQPLMSAGGYPFFTSICYEDAFGEESAFRLGDAAFLINVTNDGWFGETVEPYQHMQMARMRALETGRYLLRSTNNGLTAIVAPNGKIISQAPLFKVTTLTDTIFPMAGFTPYTRFGDYPIILFLSFILVGSLAARTVINWHCTEKDDIKIN